MKYQSRSKRRSKRDTLRMLAAVGISVSFAAALAACGGGGSSSPAPPATAATSQMAQMTSANSATVPSSTTAAASTTVATTQAVVAAAGSSATVIGSTATAAVACPGGGSAVFMVSGATLADITNGQLDAGESYSLTFNACKGASGAGAVTGVMTLDVTAATSNSLAVNFTTSNVVVSLPRGTVTLNGSSTLVRTVNTVGTTVTTTDHWTTPSYSVTTAFNGRTSTFAMTNVDITATTTVTDGILTGTTYEGTSTLSAILPNGAFSITLSTQGATHYDASGTPTDGTWTLRLPNNIISLTVAGGMATISVDYGADGTIDKVYIFTIGTLEGDAG